MNLVDANVLLYAVNEADPRHDVSRSWLDAALSGQETIGFSWVAVLAFPGLLSHRTLQLYSGQQRARSRGA